MKDRIREVIVCAIGVAFLVILLVGVACLPMLIEGIIEVTGAQRPAE